MQRLNELTDPAPQPLDPLDVDLGLPDPRQEILANRPGKHAGAGKQRGHADQLGARAFEPGRSHLVADRRGKLLQRARIAGQGLDVVVRQAKFLLSFRRDFLA